MRHAFSLFYFFLYFFYFLFQFQFIVPLFPCSLRFLNVILYEIFCLFFVVAVYFLYKFYFFVSLFVMSSAHLFLSHVFFISMFPCCPVLLCFSIEICIICIFVPYGTRKIGKSVNLKSGVL